MDNFLTFAYHAGSLQNLNSSASLSKHPASLLRRATRFLLRAGLAALLLSALYFVAALAGACWPRNRDFVSAQSGVKIWVTASEIHTDVIVPIKNEVFDWSALLSNSHTAKPDPTLDHLAVGWGDRTFYLETATWADVKLVNVASAFCGLDATAMHVQWCRGQLQEGPRCREIVLSNQQYEELCQFMSASFSRDDKGAAIKIDAPGYSQSDAFYEALGRYSAYRTCNTWTGQALGASGVRVGVWTPTTWGVMWQLD